MDQLTHEIRKSQWRDIIDQCTGRPVGMTAKQWLADNDISEKTYYYWLRKFRRETCLQMQPEKELPTASPANEVSFVDVTFPGHLSPGASDDVSSIHAAAVIRTRTADIAITNDISGELLTLILKEVSHA